jgi:hypothetical protein
VNAIFNAQGEPAGRTSRDSLRAQDGQTLTGPMAICHVMRNAVHGNVTEFILPDGNATLWQITAEMDPKPHNVQTFITPLMPPDAPTSHIVQVIEPQVDACNLTIEHDDIAPDQERFAEDCARIAAPFKFDIETGMT